MHFHLIVFFFYHFVVQFALFIIGSLIPQLLIVSFQSFYLSWILVFWEHACQEFFQIDEKMFQNLSLKPKSLLSVAREQPVLSSSCLKDL